jgi:hypothetical protein
MADEEREVLDPTNNDVIVLVPPETGARELVITDPSNDDVAMPAALYMALDEEGGQVPTYLFRFRPTLLQRGKIALGEDLFLVMLAPNNRAPLPIELQVGPGAFQLTSAIVGVDGASIRADGTVRTQLWTPEEGDPTSPR